MIFSSLAESLNSWVFWTSPFVIICLVSVLYDIFSVLSDELPFSIKEVNNFWNNSFYINLNNDIEDRFIRLVISNKGIVFWLKIKKTEYDLVKQKLNLF